MASFPPVTMTTEGLNMIAKASSGNSQDRLIITKVKLGDGVSEGNIRDYTDVISSKKEVSLSEWEDRGDGRFRYTFIYNNEGVKTGFYHREIGLFAKNGDSGTEKLIAYSNAGSYPGYIDDETKEIPYQRLMINIGVGDTDNVSGQVDASNAVTIEMLNEHDADENAHANLIKRLFGSATATMESVKQKIEDWAKKVCLPLSGGVLTGNLNASGYNITADKFIGNATYTDNANAFSFGWSPSGRYRIFAKGKKNNNDKSNVVSLIVSNIGKHDGTFEGIYVVQISNWNNRASMKIVEIIPSGNTNFPPKFGYYEDDNYFYYGYYNTMYGGYGYITVLGRENEEQIYVDKYLDTPTKPDGWTQVEETSITTQSTMIAYLSEATPAMTSLDTNNYWTKNIDGLITQIAEVNLNEEQEIDVQFPISFPQKCLFVDTKIINEEKDTSINCDFHIIEKTVDGAKLLKVGTGSPKKIVVKAIGI